MLSVPPILLFRLLPLAKTTAFTFGPLLSVPLIFVVPLKTFTVPDIFRATVFDAVDVLLMVTLPLVESVPPNSIPPDTVVVAVTVIAPVLLSRLLLPLNMTELALFPVKLEAAIIVVGPITFVPNKDKPTVPLVALILSTPL